MSDTDPTASVPAATPRLDDNGNPISAKATSTRQELADDWVLYMCFITGLAAIIAFVGLGNAFPSDGTKFTPIAGILGATGAVLGLLPFIGIFAVLRAKDA